MTVLDENYLLPDTSISLMAIATQGSIKKVIIALISKDADAELMPMSDKST